MFGDNAGCWHKPQLSDVRCLQRGSKSKLQDANCCFFFCFCFFLSLCRKNNYTFIQNWFGMVLRAGRRERERGAWHDCTLFAVITLLLEDLCVHPRCSVQCFRLNFFLKNGFVTSLWIKDTQWKSDIITYLTKQQRCPFSVLDSANKANGICFIFNVANNVLLITD